MVAYDCRYEDCKEAVCARFPDLDLSSIEVCPIEDDGIVAPAEDIASPYDDIVALGPDSEP